MPLDQNSILEWMEVENLKIRKPLTPKGDQCGEEFFFSYTSTSDTIRSLEKSVATAIQRAWDSNL